MARRQAYGVSYRSPIAGFALPIVFGIMALICLLVSFVFGAISTAGTSDCTELTTAVLEDYEYD